MSNRVPPQIKKRRHIVADASFLEEAFSAKPDDYEAAWEALKAQYEKDTKPQARLQTLAPSSLEINDAMSMFGFSGVQDLDLEQDQSTPIPLYLLANIARVQYVTNNGAGNEAYSRTILDLILVTAMYEEGKLADPDRNIHPAPVPHVHPPEDPARLELLHEVPLSTEVVHKGEQRSLTGYAGYTLFYNRFSSDPLATNLVVVEAKRRGGTDLALPQLISYLGIIHKARQEKKKENSMAYGIISDGNVFRFCRVANDGKYGQSGLLEWSRVTERGKIYSIIRSIIRTAALSSPSTTPIRDPSRRRLVLSAFGSASVSDSAKLDFGIEEAKFWEIDEEELDEYEIIGGKRKRLRGGYKGLLLKARTRKRKRGVDLEELAKIFADEPRDIKAAWAEVKEMIENARKDATGYIPSLAPSSLGFNEALELFGLEKAGLFSFDDEPETTIPGYLLENITRILAVTNNRIGGANEAFSRTVLDQIIIASIYEEGKARLNIETRGPRVTHTHPDPAAEEPAGEEPARLQLIHEAPLSRKVMHGGQQKLLAGYADYTLFYDDSRIQAMATNLLIVEAKRQNSTDSALSQLVSYMGIVHATRKEEGKTNSVVFGLASDGNSFRFCRIDNDGNFAKSRLMEWECPQDRNKIYGMFRAIIRAAALSSPSTTPIKDPAQRKLILAAFGSPGRVERFDFGLGRLQVYDLEEAEDGGYEIIEDEEE
ncbi:hypothetical protein VE04_09482 [Pseudogymnoascus sp. 24MN13]|nr:hypothetical protein VE04_09482 [Pseudogymnoascus sp. 24MN13]